MKKDMIKSCSRKMLLAAMPIAMGLTTSVQAQNSPVGPTWDCVISGQRQGTAQFQFFDFVTNKMFNVTEIIVPNAFNTNIINNSNPRNPVSTIRGGSSGGNNFVPSDQIFGEEFVTNGYWGFDAKGHTIGSFIETSDQLHCTTTAIPILTNNEQTLTTPPVTITNNPTTDPMFCVSEVLLGSTNLGGGNTNYAVADMCFTNVTICTAITNAVSFVGNVTTKRITLECSTPFGNTTYRGVLAQSLPDISGQYYGMKTQNGVEYIEFMTLANEGENNYFVGLTGPGYTYTGQAILSSQKRISFALALTPAIPTNPPVTERAVTGPFNPRNGSATMIGWDAPGDTSFIPSTQVRFTIHPEP